MSGVLEQLRLDAATTFLLDGSGQILRENDPDGSPGPHAFLGGCAEGNFILTRIDVPAGARSGITELVAAEAPWIDAAVRPNCLPEVFERLDLPAQEARVGIAYRLQRQAPARAAEFVCSNTAAGDALLATLLREGMPAHLVAAGFVGPADFWAPWCVAIEDRAIAAIAFAARIAPRSSAVGVYTFPGFRGRGLAAAVTARWSTLPALGERRLFYGTDLSNLSSQRVAERLRLPRLGLTLRIP